jgi:hypothetical protein
MPTSGCLGNPASKIAVIVATGDASEVCTNTATGMARCGGICGGPVGPGLPFLGFREAPSSCPPTKRPSVKPPPVRQAQHGVGTFGGLVATPSWYGANPATLTCGSGALRNFSKMPQRHLVRCSTQARSEGLRETGGLALSGISGRDAALPIAGLAIRS